MHMHMAMGERIMITTARTDTVGVGVSVGGWRTRTRARGGCRTATRRRRDGRRNYYGGCFLVGTTNPGSVRDDVFFFAVDFADFKRIDRRDTSQQWTRVGNGKGLGGSAGGARGARQRKSGAAAI